MLELVDNSQLLQYFEGDIMLRDTLKKQFIVIGLVGLALVSGGLLAAEQAVAEKKSDAPVQAEKSYTFAEVVHESIFGDVYSDPSKWQELSIGNFFSKGWDKPWVSPPAGGGGAPRQGWLNAYEGVFYRLSLGIGGWKHDGNKTDSYTGNLVSFTPINQRFEIQTEIPVSANSDDTNFGDFRVQARFLLSESRNFTQTFNLSFRTPTGSEKTGDGVAAIIPQYQFWANWWKGLVVRGGAGFTIPYTGEIRETGARSTFDANLSVGYYMTPHDVTPVGDMVWYVATNINQPIDDRASNDDTTVSFSPGFRTHLGRDWYMLGTVEIPVTNPEPFDHQVLFSIMKVY